MTLNRQEVLFILSSMENDLALSQGLDAIKPIYQDIVDKFRIMLAAMDENFIKEVSIDDKNFYKNDAEIGYDAGWNDAVKFLGGIIDPRDKMSRRKEFLNKLAKQDK